MKITIKILILIVAVISAISGVMIYAKTKVEPPVATRSIDQYSKNINGCYKEFARQISPSQEDSIFTTILNKINIYSKESKIDDIKGDAYIDKLLSLYAPLFMDRSFEKFDRSAWYEADHEYMLSVISNLRSVKHSDGSRAIGNNTADSLAKIENIIDSYRLAKDVCEETEYSGVSNAKTTIKQASNLAEDYYLSHCTSLVSALNNVKPSIAKSHYKHVENKVKELSKYESYSQYVYEEVLVKQVEKSLKEYEQNAPSLYGSSKRDISSLWDIAEEYCLSATSYYNK